MPPKMMRLTITDLGRLDLFVEGKALIYDHLSTLMTRAIILSPCCFMVPHLPRLSSYRVSLHPWQALAVSREVGVPCK